MPRLGGILFLDLALSTGWAYGHPGDARPTWGVCKLPGHISRGAAGMALENELDAHLDTLKPVRIGYEAPLPANLQTDAQSAFVLIGLAMLVESCAHRWSVPLVSRQSQQVRQAVIGRSYLTDEEKRSRPKPSVKKAIVLPWITKMGWSINQHDAADAAVGWAYEAGIRHPDFRKRRAA